MDARTIGALDWIVMAAYLGAMAWMGAWFARRQTSTEEYFVGGRSVPGWAAGLSLFANAISTATFVAYPGDGFRGDWTNLMSGFMLPIVTVFVVLMVIPFYRRVVRMSAYEYFENRFGYGARAYAAVLFILFNLFRMGFILFLLAKVIHTMTGWDLRTTIVVCGLVTIAYTAAGGIDAVIWTDVVQAFVMFGGSLLCLGVLLFAPEGGPGRAIRVAYEAGKFKLADLALDLSRPTVLVMMLYGISLHASVYAGNQDYVQRYLAVPTTRQAQRGLWLGCLCCVFIWTLYMFLGTLLYAYYAMSPEPLPAGVAADETKVFPYFIMTRLPTGIIGLIVASMAAAAMSTLSSCINSVALVTVYDFYGRFRSGTTDRGRLQLAKILSGVWGVAGTAVGLSMIRVEEALKFSFTVLSLLGGGLFGMILLAFFVRRAHALGVYVGLACGVLVTACGTLPEMVKLADQLGVALPAGLRNVDLSCHSFMVGTLANATTFFVGWLASLALRDRSKRDPTGLTVWDMRRSGSDA